MSTPFRRQSPRSWERAKRKEGRLLQKQMEFLIAMFRAISGTSINIKSENTKYIVFSNVKVFGLSLIPLYHEKG